MRARAYHDEPCGAANAAASAASSAGAGRGAVLTLGLLTLLPLAFGLLGVWSDPSAYQALFGGKIGGDFTNIWTAARLVLSGDISALFVSRSK